MKRVMVCLSVLLSVVACDHAQQHSISDSAVESLPSPALDGSGEAHLAVGRDGSVVMSWLEPDGNGHALKFSTLHERTWQPPRTVARGDSWFVNWADFPSVEPISESVWAAHWLDKQPGGRYAYNVAMSISEDAGATWSAPFTPHTDGTATEHGFVSLYRMDDGIGALWLDGRNMAEDLPQQVDPVGQKMEGMTLRSATISADRTIESSHLVDDLTCDCCQTDVAVGPQGPIAVYRNRSNDEIRDVYVARSVDGAWQAAQRVANDGWQIAGCPVNGPAIAIQGNTVVVAWFTGANDKSAVRVSRSDDAGNSFSLPIDIDNSRPLGRVDIALLENGDSVVSWLRKNSDGTGEISIRKISAEGIVGPPRIVAETSANRMSGFPQMVRSGDYLFFAWTDESDQQSRILTARLSVNVLFGSSG